jgi:hypothetical protein
VVHPLRIQRLIVPTLRVVTPPGLLRVAIHTPAMRSVISCILTRSVSKITAHDSEVAWIAPTY